MSYIYLLLLVFCGSALSEPPRIPPNPCPEVFNYYYDTNRNIFAEIVVPNGGSKVFSIAVNVSYIGMFENDDNRPLLNLEVETASDQLLNAKELRYKLSFSRQDVLPRLTQVKFNGRIYCRGPPEQLTNEGVSNLWVSKEIRIKQFTIPALPTEKPEPGILPLPGISTFSDERPSRTIKPGIPPFITPRPTTSPPWLKPTFSEAVIDSSSINEDIMPYVAQDSQHTSECGIADKTVNLITDGDNTTKNEFPWLVALYQWRELGYEFRCTANLIDKYHVITVASCIKFYESYLVKPENILLVFGKSSLRQWAAKMDSVIRTVSKVEVSPDYRQYSAHGDLAILTLTQPVHFSSSIKPICMFKHGGSQNTYGTVAGWGKDDYQQKFVEDVKKVDMPMVSGQACAKSNPEFLKLISDKTFCAGERNGRGPCTGDVGSPFMVEQHGRWHLKGLVSQTIINRRTSECNLYEYVVFSDVSLYYPWISSKLYDR